MEDHSMEENLESFWFQKEKKLDRLLPYYDRDKFNAESQAIFTEIKQNLGKAILLGGPGISWWIDHLSAFIACYGLRISKADHASLVTLLYETITMPATDEDTAPDLILSFLNLIKHQELLSPEDVQLPWRPLYDFYKRVLKRPGHYPTRQLMDVMQTFIKNVNRFFPVEATAEILAEIMPFICPLDRKSLTSHLGELCLFLPVMPHHAENGQGYHLWMQDLLSLWDSCNNSCNVDHNLMVLMARLAKHNVGLIDWEPYMDIMFARIMRSLKLPVLYKANIPSRASFSEGLDIQHSALWIVACLGGGSSAQKHLTDLLRAVESYFNPANTGSWMAAGKLRNVVFSLPDAFVRRLFYERKKILKWLTPVPKEKCLSEEDITAFVESLCPIVNQVLIGHVASLTSSFRRVLFCLAWLRPNIIIPSILERLMTAVTSETEPLRVSAALASLSAVVRPMVEGSRLGYPDGPMQVSNLLTTIIPMIDFNDPMKARCSALILERLMKFVPLIDSSNEIGKHPDMSQEEEEICRSTAVFKDCLVLMVDRVLSLVHYSSSSTLVSFDIRVQTMTVTIFRLVLIQTPPEYFKIALSKLHDFITDNIAPGPMLGQILEAFVFVNAEETWKVLLPSVIETILSITDSEDVQTEEILSSELLYNLGLLRDLVVTGPLTKLLPYLPLLSRVLDRTLHLENLEGHLIATKVLERVISMASKMIISNFRSSDAPYDTPPGVHLHIRDWGKSIAIKDVKADWIIPDKEAIACIQQLINRFLPSELQRIETFISGSDNLKKESLQQSLRILKAVLESQLLLPFWEEPPLHFDDIYVPDKVTLKVDIGLRGELTMPDGSNMRYSLIPVVERLQDKLLSSAEDDTTSCSIVVEIWKKLLIRAVKQEREYRAMTQWERDPTSLPNMPRLTLLCGAYEQSLERCSFFRTPLTAAHARGLLCVLRLATSHYSKVRILAQDFLHLVCEYYHPALVHKILEPSLLSNLKVDSVEHHELFKGTLYVLDGTNFTYLDDWKLSSELWMALINSKPTEKLSVIRKIGKITKGTLSGRTEIVQREVSDGVVKALSALWSGHQYFSKLEVDQSFVDSVLLAQADTNASKLKEWHDLQIKLANVIESGALHWRHCYLAVAFLRRLITTVHERSSAKSVRCLLQCLIHDNIHIRKVAPLGLGIVLQQQKQKTKYIVVKSESVFPANIATGTGDERTNATLLQYDKDKCPSSDAEWAELKFIHKENLGFMKWPKEIKIPSPNNEQAPFDNPDRTLLDDEKEFDEFFMNEKNVAALVSFLSLEKSTFEDYYVLFSRLLRNFGDKYLPYFKPHIEGLLDQKLETQQMFLFALLAGIINGTKRWSYSKLVSLWDWLAPVIVAAHENLCVVDDRTLSLIPSMRNRDPYTQYWLIEILMDDPLRDDASVLGCRRLDLVSSILLMKNWRVVSLAHRAFDYVKPYLSHHYKNVRNSVGRLLGKIFHTDFQLPGFTESSGPHIEDFISFIVPQLEALKSLNVSVHSNATGKDDMETDDGSKHTKSNGRSAEQDCALRLFETVSVCMQQMLRDSPAAMHPCFYELLELSILLENVGQDKELKQICERNLSLLASAFIRPSHMPAALAAICKVDNHPSWAMRVSCLGFLQVLVFQNMPILFSQPDWMQKVLDLVVQRLDDPWIEVQQKAGEVLSGLLHCHFIPNPLQLMERFKEKASIRLSRKSPDPSKIRVRHAGIIGLCAYVRAFPYDVPDFVPVVIGILGDHLNDPHPISATIRDTLSSFQRTHIGQWNQHRRCFTEEQLNALSNMVLPPSHYV